MNTSPALPPPAQHANTPNASPSGSDSFFEAHAAPQPSLSENEEPSKTQYGHDGQSEILRPIRAGDIQIWENQGTHLFTITERSSVTTMKTLPNNTTFQHRITRAQQPPTNPNIDQLRLDFDSSLRRRQALSLDDQALHKLHMLPSEG